MATAKQLAALKKARAARKRNLASKNKTTKARVTRKKAPSKRRVTRKAPTPTKYGMYLPRLKEWVTSIASGSFNTGSESRAKTFKCKDATNSIASILRSNSGLTVQVKPVKKK